MEQTMNTEVTTVERNTFSFDTPKKYKVVLLNDDSTPMAFVIELLVHIFNKNKSEAENITLQVHNSGRGIAGIYYYEIAEQKVHEATSVSRANSFPLSFKIEEE
jgi:ATP-dependent Clp protease adaptor protein ClpS